MPHRFTFRVSGRCLLCVSVLHLAATEHLRVCLVQNPGFGNCKPGADPQTFTGLDVELVRLVGGNLAWAEVPDPGAAARMPVQGWNGSTVGGLTFSFLCTELRETPTINLLSDSGAGPGAECAMGAGALTATQERLRQGVRFSWPHLRTGLAAVTHVEGDTTTNTPRWAFLKPFTVGVWVAILLTTAFVPLLLFVVENLLQHGRLPVGWSLLTEWRNATYTMLLTCFNLGVLEVLSAPSQALLVTFAFTNLILVASYTANLAAVLTTRTVPKTVQSIQQLRGMRGVYAHSIYLDRLASNHGVYAHGMDWQGERTFHEVAAMLRSGEANAYIYDKPLLQYWLNRLNTQCDLAMTHDVDVGVFDYGVAFHTLLPFEVVEAFSRSVLKLQSTEQLMALQAKFVEAGGRFAVTACDLETDTSLALAWGAVSGLWIIMGAAGVMCVVACVWRLGSMCCCGGGTSDLGGGGDSAGVITRQLSMRRGQLNASFSRGGQRGWGAVQEEEEEEEEEERKGHSAREEGAVCNRGGVSSGGDRSQSGSAASGHVGGGGDGKVVVVVSEDGKMSPGEGEVVRGSEVGGGEGETNMGGGAGRGGLPPASAVGRQGGAAYPVIPAASAALGGPCPTSLHAVEAGAGSRAGAGPGPCQSPLPATLALSAPQVCLAGGPGSARQADLPSACPAHSLSLPGHSGGAGEGVPRGLGPGGVLPRSASHESHTSTSALTTTPSLRARLDRMRANVMAVARQVVVVDSLQAAAAAAGAGERGGTSLTPNLNTFVNHGKQGGREGAGREGAGREGAGREGAGRGSTGQAGSAPSPIAHTPTPTLSSAGSTPAPHLPWAALLASAASAPAAAIAAGGTGADGAPAAAGVGASVWGGGAQQPSTPPQQPAA